MIRLFVLAATLFSAAGPALALSPSEVFEKLSPSVWAVRGLDSQERPFSYGSAVVIGPGRLVTNCHVLAKAKSLQLRRDNLSYEAKLEHADVERDLCTLSVANFAAPAVSVLPLSKVRVGQRVYAIGNPEKLALTLSEGLISGLRSEDEKLPPVQTSAPISPGSSGGGLFDEQGRLIGITTLIVVGRARVAQNLNFAVPAEWIAQVPERAKEQLAKRRQSPSMAAPSLAEGSSGPAAAQGLPPPGTSWRYSFNDRRYGNGEREFTVHVTWVRGWDVGESVTLQNGDSSKATVNAREIRFFAHRVGGDYSVVELAPYFYSSGLSKGTSASASPQHYRAKTQWQMTPPDIGDDETVVPSGTYKTIRVTVSGNVVRDGIPIYNSVGSSIPVRFHYTAWYAPEVNRYVRVQHQTWNAGGHLIGDEVVQLLEYKPN
jgi:hypothetical protein